MLNYNEVPNNILTSKDIDYLSDMFQWNYGALKNSNNAIDMVNDQEIVSVLEESCKLFNDNINSILNILESRGVVSE